MHCRCSGGVNEGKQSCRRRALGQALADHLPLDYGKKRYPSTGLHTFVAQRTRRPYSVAIDSKHAVRRQRTFGAVVDVRGSRAVLQNMLETVFEREAVSSM